ncbi:metallophosphoesterase [Sunxiuqinia sp. A32]|uniref:metallophosphoesterase n=1 Tax=Sunxiuqinia sp. A32 TaxID=3461496 RepID=UPI00404610F6
MRGIGSAFYFFLIFMILVEVLAYLAAHQLLPKKSKKFTYLYSTLSLIFIGILAFAFLNPSRIRETVDYQFFYFVISITVLNLIPKLIVIVFLFISWILRLMRLKQLAKNVLMGGLILSLGILISIGWGITFGRLSLRLEKQEIHLSDLPESLDGISIVQLSDLHLASFKNTETIAETVDIVNKLEPDIIVFTGDMVNNYYEEMVGFEDELAALKSKYGKFAILGNHDYGDYSNWETDSAKIMNHRKLCNAIEEAGFALLFNESESIQIKDTSIFIVGVENWGHPPFPQYAELDKAITGTPDDGFKILLSHDPAHWEAKVLPDTKISLTLSGHTHAAQSGFKIAGIEFSPMYFLQKYWGGLYENENRYLYVNRGLGCVGLLGRMDMRPEITLINLFSDGVETNRE